MGSGRRHALGGGIQRTQDLTHVATWVFHRRLDRFEPVTLTARIAVRVHDEKRHRYCHCFRFKQWKYLVFCIEVAGEAEYRDFLLRGAYPLDKIGVGLGAGAWPKVCYTCPGEVANLGVAVVHPEAEAVRPRRIQATQVLDPFIARPALPMLPTAQLGAGDARSGQPISDIERIEAS